jgi:hypothetical protein
MPWAISAGVECLLSAALALQGVGVEQIASLLCERQAAYVPAKVDGLDETFVSEVANGVVVCVEVLFGHDSERADGGQRAAILAVQLVHTVAIDNEFAFLAAREIEVVNQAVARVVIVSVPLAVDAWAAIAAIPVVVLARIVPSSVRHRPSCAHSSRALSCP